MNTISLVVMMAGVSAEIANKIATENLASPAFPWVDLMGATVLAILAIGLVIAEVFVASVGLFALAAMGCALAAIIMAFAVSAAIGWVFLVVITVVIVLVLRWSLARLSASALVPKSAIITDAGYHRVTDALGIVAGAQGVLVTMAVPSGRARFAGGEVDVTVQGSSGKIGDQVRVLRIDGPLVAVAVESVSSAAPIQ